MSEPIDYDSRSILEYIPNIGYVEPDVITEIPESFFTEEAVIENKVKKAKSVQLLAQNVEAIAEGLQEEADNLAAGFEINLKSGTSDSSIILAMKRHYPNDNSKKITYEQYKRCKDVLREVANNVSDKVLDGLSHDALERELNIAKGGNTDEFLDLISPEETNRPEEDPVSEILEPLDSEEFQDLIMKHLANALWSSFIKPVVQTVLPGIPLPDEIASLPEGSPSPSEMMGKK